jgi:hypothetical protein
MTGPAARYGSRRACDRCGGTFTLDAHKPGWVATTKPRPAWVCPQCCRDTGMQPGDPTPRLERGSARAGGHASTGRPPAPPATKR